MKNDHLGEHLIFVGGSPRSGTTMLQSMLNRHPAIFGGPEFDLIPTITNLRNQLLASHDNGRIDSFCDKTHIDRGIAQLIEELLLPAATRNGKQWLSEKTPMNVLVFDPLLDILPRARFIHLVRDPRAVALSMLAVADRYRQKGMEPPTMIANPGQVIHTILQHVKAGVEASHKSPERVHTLKYEALLLKPHQATRDICMFLGLEWSESMLDTHGGSHLSTEQIAADGGIWIKDEKTADTPKETCLNKWKDVLSLAQQQELSEVFHALPLYSELGYRFDDIDAPLETRRHAS